MKTEVKIALAAGGLALVGIGAFFASYILRGGSIRSIDVGELFDGGSQTTQGGSIVFRPTQDFEAISYDQLPEQFLGEPCYISDQTACQQYTQLSAPGETPSLTFVGSNVRTMTSNQPQTSASFALARSQGGFASYYASPLAHPTEIEFHPVYDFMPYVWRVAQQNNINPAVAFMFYDLMYQTISDHYGSTQPVGLPSAAMPVEPSPEVLIPVFVRAQKLFNDQLPGVSEPLYLKLNETNLTKGSKILYYVAFSTLSPELVIEMFPEELRFETAYTEQFAPKSLQYQSVSLSLTSTELAPEQVYNRDVLPEEGYKGRLAVCQGPTPYLCQETEGSSTLQCDRAPFLEFACDGLILKL